MRDGEAGDVREVDDVRALGALGHRDRARIMDALAVHGPSTTTTLADALGLATGSVSHHLRVLTEVGLVRPAPETATDRRQRRWALVTRGMRYSPGSFRDRPAGEEAARTADAALLRRQYDAARTFLDTAEEPWDDAAYGGHIWLRLTPEELAGLGAELDELLLRWRRREITDDDPDRRAALAFVRVFPSEP